MDDIFLWLAIGLLFAFHIYNGYLIEGLKEENQQLRLELQFMMDDIQKIEMDIK